MTVTYTPDGGIYSGNLHIALLDANDNSLGFRDVGNTRALSCDAPKVDKKTKKGYRNENFGLDVETQIKGQTQQVKFTPDDITKENLAMALFGTASAIAAQTGAAIAGATNPVTAKLGKWVKLPHRRIKSTPAPVIKDDSDTTTYVEGTDFEINYNYGLILALEGGAIADDDVLHCGYSTDDHPAGYQVQANKITQLNVRMLLLGKNTITNDDVEVEIYKASLNPSAIDWITEEFNKIDIVGDILSCASGTWDVRVIPPKAV